MVDVNYAWEKFHGATRDLASPDEPIRERLRFAWHHLHRLDPDDLEAFFPHQDQQGCVRRVFDGLSEENGGAARLELEEAEMVAACIVSLYDHVARSIGPD